MLEGRIIKLVFRCHFSWRLTNPTHERVELRSVLLFYRVDLVLLPNFVVFSEMLVEVDFELLVANEPHAAITALELNSFIELRNGHDIQPIKL